MEALIAIELGVLIAMVLQVYILSLFLDEYKRHNQAEQKEREYFMNLPVSDIDGEAYERQIDEYIGAKK